MVKDACQTRKPYGTMSIDTECRIIYFTFCLNSSLQIDRKSKVIYETSGGRLSRPSHLSVRLFTAPLCLRTYQRKRKLITCVPPPAQPPSPTNWHFSNMFRCVLIWQIKN